MYRRFLTGAVLLVSLSAVAQGQGRKELLQSAAESSSLKPSGPPSDYDAATLTEFSAELAPVLERYGVRGVVRQEWSGSPTVSSTVYEMIDTSAAYGFFTIRRRERAGAQPPIPLGSESFQSGSRIAFWQSNYVVEIEGPAGPSHALAQALSENILGRSRKPPVSMHLPPNYLAPGSESYILGPEAFDEATGVEPGMVGFDHNVEVASARYNVNGAAMNLLLLLYPTQQIAAKYAEQFDAALAGSFRKRAGPLVAVITGTRDAAAANAVLDQVNHEFKVTWNEPPPDLSLGELIVTIFTFIGIAGLFTLVAGISFGGLRIFVKARYPNRVFDRPEDMEIIQLKLGQGLTRTELSK